MSQFFAMGMLRLVYIPPPDIKHPTRPQIRYSYILGLFVLGGVGGSNARGSRLLRFGKHSLSPKTERYRLKSSRLARNSVFRCFHLAGSHGSLLSHIYWNQFEVSQKNLDLDSTSLLNKSSCSSQFEVSLCNQTLLLLTPKSLVLSEGFEL